MAASAASCSTALTSPTYTAPQPNTLLATTSATTASWTVPAGVTGICVRVSGGGGGTGYNTTLSFGGSGGQVSAWIPVTPGEVLTLVVGQGGGITDSGTGVVGGGGYGKGGDVSGATSSGGGSGGGGSAILRGTTPLVVAGGGGGGGGSASTQSSPAWTQAGGRGGNAESTGTAFQLGVPSSTATATAGSPASGATPGGVPAASTWTSGGTTTITPTPTLTAGLAGSVWISGVGGNGANGATTSAVRGLTYSRGAGGGGYAGGGSGAGITFSTNNNNVYATIGGPGGGGSNYVAPSVQLLSFGLASNGNAVRGERKPGQNHYRVLTPNDDRRLPSGAVPSVSPIHGCSVTTGSTMAPV